MSKNKKVKEEKLLSKKRLTKQDIRAIISEEGLGDSIRDLLVVSRIDDKDLAKLVKLAKKALIKVQDYIYGC